MDVGDLATLGDVSMFDASKIRKTTQLSMRSHLNLLRYNNISLTREHVQSNDMNKMLDGLKTRKGDLLKPEYKIQIAATLKRLYGDNMAIDVNVYRNDILRRKPHAENFQMMEKIKLLINHAAQFIRNVEKNKSFGPDLTSYEASLAILMSSCTSLRIAELHQITVPNLKTILRNKPIFLHSKGFKSSSTRCDIVPNRLFTSCIMFVFRNRDSIIKNVKIYERSNRYPECTLGRIQGDSVFITSVSQLRRSAKQLAVSFSLDIENLGFNKFRKYIKSILVDECGHGLAQFMNAHSNVNTTITNYDVGTKQSMERTLKRVLPSSTDDEYDTEGVDEPMWVDTEVGVGEQTVRLDTVFETDQSITRKASEPVRSPTPVTRSSQPVVRAASESVQTTKIQNARKGSVISNVSVASSGYEPPTLMDELREVAMKKNRTYFVPKHDNFTMPYSPFSPSGRSVRCHIRPEFVGFGLIFAHDLECKFFTPQTRIRI